MSDISSLSPLNYNSPVPSQAGRKSPEQIKEVAQQFESLLIGEMLKSMKSPTGGGWLGTGDDQAGAALSDFAEQHVAQVLSQSGGFGLANLIQKGLQTAQESEGRQASTPAVAKP